MADPALPEAARAAPAHPLVVAAAALIVVNDFVLRGWAPGWLTGKLSDVGWLVVAPVLIAAVVSRCGAPRAAKAAGLVIAGGFYTVLQLWPPLGTWIQARHVADVGDLLVLPALLGAVYAWRSPRRARRFGPAALPLLAAVLVADDWGWNEPASAPCGEEMEWDAAVPLQLQLDARAVPVDSDGFLAGMRLTEDGGPDVPLVAAGHPDNWAATVVCARAGLRGDTAYTWEIGPWSAASGNEVAFEHDRLPTVRFRTTADDGPPAADAAACQALTAVLGDAALERCAHPDTGGFDTGPATGSP